MGKRIKALCKVTAIFCLTAVTLTGCNLSKLMPTANQNKTLSEKDYLNQNYISLDASDNNDFSSFKLLDGDLNKDIFLTGQISGVKANSDLDLKFLKYFKEKAGVKYYLQEIPYSYARVVDEYLATGNEKILDELYANTKGSVLWSKEQYNKWKKLYEFNKSLPNNEKIMLIGIDIEQQPINAIKYMISLLPNEAPPIKINGAINELKNSANISTKSINTFKDLCTSIKKSIDENRDEYNLYLKDKLFDFEMVNNNGLKTIEAYSSKDIDEYNKVRGQKLYENFVYIYSKMPNKGKIYGQVTTYNMFQKTHKGVDYFATLVNSKDSPVKSKILSIMYIYKTCDRLIIGQNGVYTSRMLTNYSSDNAQLDPLIKDDLTLIKLNGDGSPFKKDLLWPDSTFYPGTRVANEVTTDYYQYIVVIKNSPAELPWDK